MTAAAALKIAKDDVEPLDAPLREILDACDDIDRAADIVRSKAKVVRRLLEAAYGAALVRERPTEPELESPPSVPPDPTHPNRGC